VNRIGIVMTLILLAAGCATAHVPMAPKDADAAAKQFPSIPGKANVYIYRNEGGGGIVKFGIYVDGQPASQTAKYTYVNLQLEPGTHVIRGHAHNNSEVTLDAKAGEVYFIWQEVTLGSGFSASNEMRIVDAEAGKAGVRECKLVAEREYPAAAAAASRGNEQRLLELKKLRDQGLISEAEYSRKREEILKGI